MHISLRLSPQVGPQVFDPTLREQVVGADAAALRQHVEDDYDTARQKLGLPYGPPAGRLYSTVVGYRVDEVSAAAASVRLLIDAPGRDGGTVHAATVVGLRWVGADWALVAPPNGDWNTVVSLVTDTSGYTPLTEGA